MFLPLASLALLQAVSGNQALPDVPPELRPEARAGRAAPAQNDRMAQCQQLSRRNPASAVTMGTQWAQEATGAERALARQCLGHAYVSLLRWDAAEQAFLGARDATAATEAAGRARLAAMAGNAALAGSRNDAALAAFDLGLLDATAAGDRPLAGELAADRARALVALGRTEEAASALAAARRDAPGFATGWLLSATLARRMERLDEAQEHILTAATLAPLDPAVGLEGGLIAALAGRDEAARQSWQSVIDMAPASEEAETARTYIAQLPPVGAVQ